MPNGFLGRPAMAFMTHVHEAHTVATRDMKRQFEAQNINAIRHHPLPFDIENAHRGNFFVGTGMASNIVASNQDYGDIATGINHADEQLGYCVHQICSDIEAMCNTIYNLPKTVPQCLNMCSQLKSALIQFRETSDQLIGITREYGNAITNIEH